MLKNLLVMTAALLLSVSSQALTDKERKAIEERIKPVGEVCLEGDNSCGGAAAPAAAGGASAARSGKAVYDTACMACHMTGAGGAPIMGDKAAWAPRIAKGIDALYDGGINGVPGTGMMAKGGCMNCSDDEIKAAVDHMVENSQ